jgi:hypothetical protein
MSNSLTFEVKIKLAPTSMGPKSDECVHRSINMELLVRFEVLTAVTMKNAVFSGCYAVWLL